jgi:hypothetical protein
MHWVSQTRSNGVFAFYRRSLSTLNLKLEALRVQLSLKVNGHIEVSLRSQFAFCEFSQVSHLNT